MDSCGFWREENGLKRLDAILIAGPTASGKSALAVDVAREYGGAVVNADSMQVYDILRVLTARPQPQEMKGVDHFLFGHVDPSITYSVARYLEDVRPVLHQLKAEGSLPVITGGTGLYFKALLEGLSAVPPIDPALRAEIRERASHDLEEVYRELALLDVEGAAQLKPGDSQRICRLLEVVRSTGKPLSWWQARERTRPILDSGSCLKIVLAPDRKALRHKIAARFGSMIENGALEEVEQLLAMRLSPDLPSMRAIGVSQLRDYLSGKTGREEAVRLAVTATGQYAKRQSTWFRNQFCGADTSWHREENPERAKILIAQLLGMHP